jgi:diadenosine tetraphosphate (Ap4A) HIT family hydrolase
MSTPTIPNDCPLCPSNKLLKVDIIAEEGEAYLIPASGSPGCFLIIPTQHAETPADISDNWWRDVKTVFKHIPAPLEHYNLSFNVGKLAGQTVKHLHMWVIPREAGQASTGMGLAALISKANQE